MFRTLRPAQLAVDVLLAVGCVALRLSPGVSPALAAVVIVMGIALALRRLSPALALIVAWIGAGGQMVALLNPDAANLAILAVLFATARYGTRTVRWAGLASAIGGALIATGYLTARSVGLLGSDPIYSIGSSALTVAIVFPLMTGLAIFGLSWTLGQLARTWALARVSKQERAAAEERLLVEQERNRIARDMHDVVAHSLAVVIAQADGARYSRDPGAADVALETIATTSRNALGDVRVLLGQLRHAQGAAPQPVLADLDVLVEQMRDSGLNVESVQTGTASRLPAGHQLAAYRIAQEAMTNALRHGVPGAPVSLRLDWTPGEFVLEVRNMVAESAAGPPSGHGIIGMRERALLVGGTLTADREGESFVVRAVLPMSPAGESR